MSTTAGRFRAWHIVLLVLGGIVLIAAVDLGVQEIYHRYLHPPTPTLPPPSATPTPLPSATPTPSRTPTASPTPPLLTSPTVPLTRTATPTPLSFADQQVQEALQQVAFQQLLLKTAIELLRAEDYLVSGELKQVERELVAVSATLEQAAELADESLQGSIADLQRDLSRLREDLYLRPERLQEGMRRLWQRVDVLIGD